MKGILEKSKGLLVRLSQNRYAQIIALVLGSAYNQIDLQRAVYAIWFAVAADIITKWISIFVKNGGIKQAFTNKAFSMKEFIIGMILKVFAFQVMIMLANESRYIISGDGINQYIVATIYSFLFVSELTSNIKNLVDSGVEQLRPLLQRFQVEELKAANSSDVPDNVQPVDLGTNQNQTSDNHEVTDLPKYDAKG